MMETGKDKFEEMTYDNLNFLKIKPEMSLELDQLEAYNGVIIEYSNHHSVYKKITEIRSHRDKQVYLIPIFLLVVHENPDDSVLNFADGELSNLSNLDSVAAKTRKIKNRM